MEDSREVSLEPETTFVWPTTKFAFQIDERIDPALFAACTNAWLFLDATLDGLRLDRTNPAFASRVLLVYFAARLYGATVASAMLLAHRLGREAIILGRSQYEYFIKMLYFDHFHGEAKKITDLLEAHDFKFAQKVRRDVAKHWSPDDMERLQELSKQARELRFKDDSGNGLRGDDEFFRLSGGDNPFATWFFKNLDSAFNVHWNYGSTIVHASPVDLINVVVPREDGHFYVNVDSRMKGPNCRLIDTAQRCFSAMGLLRWRFGLQFTDEHIEWAKTFTPLADRYKDEPMDLRSMHE